MVIPLVAVVAVVALWWFTATRAVFSVALRDGRAEPIRGRIPGPLLADFARIAAAAPEVRGTVTALRQEHGSRLRFSGRIDAGTAQRMRNAFGLYPMSRLRQAPVIERPTLARLGLVAWLASWLSAPFDR